MTLSGTSLTPALSEQTASNIAECDLNSEVAILRDENVSESEVEAIQKKINIRDVQTIMEVTQSCTSQAAPAIDAILKTVRADRLPVFDSLVSQIIDEADTVSQAIEKDSLLSRISNRFLSVASIAKRRIEKAIHASDSMMTRIERIRAEIEKQVAIEKSNITVMGNVAKERRDIMRRTVASTVACRRALEAGQKELADLRAQAEHSGSSALSADIMSVETNVALLANTADTLERYRLLMFNGILEAISAASSSYRAVSVVTTQTDIAINTIKQNVAVYSTAQSTSAILSTEKRLRDASDAMSRMTSDLLKQNALDSAKAIATPGISLDTIEYNTKNLRDSMIGVRQILSARMEARKLEQARVDALYDEARKAASGI